MCMIPIKGNRCPLPTQIKNAREICEQILINQKLSNVKLGILRSENAVADRLLARGLVLDAIGDVFGHAA